MSGKRHGEVRCGLVTLPASWAGRLESPRRGANGARLATRSELTFGSLQERGNKYRNIVKEISHPGEKAGDAALPCPAQRQRHPCLPRRPPRKLRSVRGGVQNDEGGFDSLRNHVKKVSDSLAGRCAILSLSGLTVREICTNGREPAGIDSHADLIIGGAFPNFGRINRSRCGSSTIPTSRRTSSRICDRYSGSEAAATLNAFFAPVPHVRARR